MAGEDVPSGKAKTIGPRGGVRYEANNKGNPNPTPHIDDENFKPPTYIIQGPGIDMAFFRTSGGFTVKHKGPYCSDAIELANDMSKSGSKFKEIIDELCKEFNCHIVNNEDN